ncbi:hypothetical protein [Melghiribacillus thermohalophilus]|uniref:hypothetical protein n=1 Tax=Melghiribacillus thermohalophilus TaxID=1324956 RepID=UPI00104E5CEB|nr:hypothetical protein [Melghiribacillus thermohalophilus]
MFGSLLPALGPLGQFFGRSRTCLGSSVPQLGPSTPLLGPSAPMLGLLRSGPGPLCFRLGRIIHLTRAIDPLFCGISASP